MEYRVDFDVFRRAQDLKCAWRGIKTESIFLRVCSSQPNFYTWCYLLVLICQCVHKLHWLVDGKPEMGLTGPVWRHWWFCGYMTKESVRYMKHWGRPQGWLQLYNDHRQHGCDRGARPTVSAFQYFRWCALTKPAVSHFLRRIYSLSKEGAL